MKKNRDSNIELLRIVAMLLVLITHACYVALDSPSRIDIETSIGSAFIRALSESFSEVCVNSFILISGWFGIQARFSRFVEFVFQILFIRITICFIANLLGLTNPMSANEWIDVLTFKYGSYWFVRAFIILYLFAPVLNFFAESCDRFQMKCFLISFYFVQTIYGFYNSGGWFSGGYSPLSFMGLYLLARYIRQYPNRFTQFNKTIDISLYIIISIFTAICSLLSTCFFDKTGTVLFLYSSPMVILSSVFFFLFFTKLSFQSAIINWISVSSFAVYIVHCSPAIFHPYYINVIRHWFEVCASTEFFVYTSGLIIAIFLISILFDKIRIAVWRLISTPFLNKKSLWYNN